MNAPPAARASWSLENDSARLVCGRLGATIGAPAQEGAAVETLFGGKPTGVRLFSTTDPLEAAAERYARGVDFVTTHSACDAFPFRTQFAWSAFELTSGDGVALTLTVSLQTDLLDTRPELTLDSHCPGCEALLSGDGSCRLEHSEGSSVWLAVHPSDLAESALEADGDRCRLTLSPEFLEKGVIRRCRVAAFFLREGGESGFRAALDEFSRLPLPLTA